MLIGLRIFESIMNYFKRRRLAFGYAAKGIRHFFAREDHAKIHLAAALLVVLLGFLVHISKLEWIAILLCIAVVLALEALNSALEKLTDIASPEFSEKAGQVKDIAAGAVLIAALAATVVGCLVFIPHFLYLYETL